MGDAYVVASETCAFDVIGATFEREVEPGELVIIDEFGLRSTRFVNKSARAICSMEYVYFARPDSNVDEINVHTARKSLGKQLAYNQVVFRYVDAINGSRNHIAGITNEKGNVLGMMPHPERAVEALMGRTHGVHAEPTTFGLKLGLWYEEMKRNIERFKAAAEGVRFGKLSGAVGTYANINPAVEQIVCEKLGLQAAPISTQTLQRDRHADYMGTLALIATSIEKFAVEIRGLQKSETREVEF